MRVPPPAHGDLLSTTTDLGPPNQDEFLLHQLEAAPTKSSTSVPKTVIKHIERDSFIQRNDHRIIIAIGIIGLLVGLGLFGWASTDGGYSHRTPRRRRSRFVRKREGTYPKMRDLTDFKKGILIGSAYAVGFLGGSLLVMLIYGLGIGMLGWVLLGTLCTLAALGVVVLIGALIFWIIESEIDPTRSHEKLEGCYTMMMTIIFVIPLTLLLGGLALGLLMPLFVPVAFQLGVAVLAWFCLLIPLAAATVLTFLLMED